MIAIEGMEMPSCCLWDCPLAREDGGACQLEDVRTSDKERPIDCPLVEIVTCKDCKHRDPEDKFCDCGHAIKWSSPREDNFFCADAIRKE